MHLAHQSTPHQPAASNHQRDEHVMHSSSDTSFDRTCSSFCRKLLSCGCSFHGKHACMFSCKCLPCRILCLTKAKQKDKQTSAMLERKSRAEAEARLSAEKQLAELHSQKLEEAANAARSLTNRYFLEFKQRYRKTVFKCDLT